MSTYVRSGTVLVRVNTGPPTWWKPSLGISKSGGVCIFKIGWLRTAVQIGVGSRRHAEEEN